MNCCVSTQMFVFLILASTLVSLTFSCEADQTRFGCRIHDRECLCGVGCHLEYRYSSRQECVASLRGRAKDPCNRAPCRNNGLCVQKSEHPGYKCLCMSTGFYGPRCENRCPSGGSDNYPTDCIVI